MENIYSSDFYKSRQQLAQKSASIILKHLFSNIKINSVIDFGCGTGTWLHECREYDIENILGIDGNWVDIKSLEINKHYFHNHDLSLTQYIPSKKFDLALCIEVAEHLPPAMGASLIESLINSSDIILFSSAVANQRGTGHLNEQPQEFWAKIFSQYKYDCIDFIRPVIWNDNVVNVIYKQNMLLYVKSELAPVLFPSYLKTSDSYNLNRIHPDLFSIRSISTLNKNPSLIPFLFKTLKKYLHILS